ncbi:MAG TPA: PepSY domain-containing protein [Nevskia sp.]|nr:PepSY domain-containing protein [Nevskia sp.]
MSEPPPPTAKRRLSDTLRPWRSRAVINTARERAAAQPQAKKNLTATLREWHKRAGLFAFVFLGWLGVTGIFLNEASDLDLNAKRVGWPWLMAIYGLRPAPPASGLGAGGHWLAIAGEASVLDGKPLAQPLDAPLGLVAAPEPGSAKVMLYAAQADSVVLLRPDGSRVDELRMPPLPIAAIRRIGLVKGHPGSFAIQGSDTAYQSEDEGESWKPVPATDVQWSVPQPLPQGVRDALLPYSRPSVSVQQLLVDVHSGRLFGRSGTYVIDLVGLAALLLATSGVWMMWRTNNARKKNQAAARLTAGAKSPPARKPPMQKPPSGA